MEFAKAVETRHFGRPSPWYTLVLWLVWRLYGWVKFTGKGKGALVQGVSQAPPTKGKLQNLWLKLVGWKMGAYFRVSTENAAAGYYVGYIPVLCVTATSICMTKCFESKFVMKIGHEDCRFFAVDLHGKEIPIEYLGTFPISDSIHQAQSF